MWTPQKNVEDFSRISAVLQQTLQLVYQYFSLKLFAKHCKSRETIGKAIRICVSKEYIYMVIWAKTWELTIGEITKTKSGSWGRKINQMNKSFALLQVEFWIYLLGFYTTFNKFKNIQYFQCLLFFLTFSMSWNLRLTHNIETYSMQVYFRLFFVPFPYIRVNKIR